MYQFLDFKSFEEASLDLSRPLTILIGKNGSGKSNAIEAVELMAQLANGRPLSDIADIGRSVSGFQIRGGLTACVRTGKSTFGLSIQNTVQVAGVPQPCRYEFRVQTKPMPRIQSEEFYIGKELVFSVLDNGDRLHSLPLPDFDEEPSEAAAAALRPELIVPFVFDPQPRLMRAYERIGGRVLARDGANVSAVLYALHIGSEDERAALARILQLIRQLPEEPFEQFDFVVTPLNDVLFGIREVTGGPIIDARLLSDGTLRCLAVLTALETVEKGSRVIIEEFDNGLHPSRVNLLTQAISEACTRRNLKILVTTHNPATLDGLTPAQLEGVVLCVWDRTRRASRLIPLLELPRADVLLERGHLGDLVTRRVLEQHLMPNFEEKQKDKAKEWLDSLT